MKKLFTILAAMLLTSVCAMAQSNDATPLKGDVNEDGTVDVADLVAVMTIMRDGGGAVGEKMCYWYAGVNNGNAVTDENFINIASRIAESQIPETGSVTATGQYIYIVMPETRYLSALTDGNGAAVDYDCTDVFGYHIYKTSEKVNGAFNYATAETIYYWYVGQDDPSTMTEISPIVTDTSSPGWREIGTSLPTYSSTNKLWSADNIITTGESLAKQYIVIPANSSACPRDGGGNDASTVDIYNKLSNVTISGVEYKVYETVGRMRKHDLNIY